MCVQYINMHAVSNTFIIDTIYISIGTIITITMHLCVSPSLNPTSQGR